MTTNRRLVSRAWRTRFGLPVVSVCCLAALPVSLLAAFPKATGSVNDFAKILDSTTRADLELIGLVGFRRELRRRRFGRRRRERQLVIT